MSHANRQIDAHLQQGKRLHGAGRLGEAGQIYQQILTFAPAHPGALHMMGVLRLQMGQPAEALGWIERAIATGTGQKVPGGLMAEFYVHHAHVLLALGRATDAIAACHAALRLKRGSAEAFQAMGHALTDTGDYTGALKAYQDAVRLKPDLPDLLNNLGTALHHANQLDEAARTLIRAHRREPRDPGILVNLSTALRDLGRFAEAETRLAQALRLAPDDPAARYDHAWLMLLLGRFEQAWPGWEERFRAGATVDRGFTQPRWHGEPLAGRTLLIHAEQGLGDTIQFCRFPFPTDGPVVFEVQSRLARLLGNREDGVRVVRAGDPLPQFDMVCPLMSLPAVFGTTEATIPARVPYLRAETEAVARWRARLGEHGFRVGIAWQGNPSRREDTGRSIRLEHFLPLAGVPGVRLISLQKDTGAEQLTSAMPNGAIIETLGDDFDAGPDGFIDTAAVMMNLDLVISSDTAIPIWRGRWAGRYGWRFERCRTGGSCWRGRTAPGIRGCGCSGRPPAINGGRCSRRSRMHWPPVSQRERRPVERPVERRVPMDDPVVPVSWGELLDKVTILEIKCARLRAPEAVANARRELTALEPVLVSLRPSPPGLRELRSALAAVNQRLWAIEDRIREREAAADFGPEFVALARSVYHENDERGRIKRAINTLLGSRLMEEKQYSAY